MTTFTTASVSNLVTKLPREISLYIYTEFLETNCKYEDIITEFRSDRVKNLDATELCVLINFHFENTKLIFYLRKREELFDIYYRKIIINNEVWFTQMTPINSLTYCWIYMVYH